MSSTVTLVCRPARLRHAKGDVAGAAGDIEMLERRGLRRLHLRDEHILPDAMQSARHQVVHDVVALGDLVKNVVDHILLVVERDFGIAEMGSDLSL